MDWQTIYWLWRSRIAELGVAIDDFFTSVNVHLAENPKCDASILALWKTSDIASNQFIAQSDIDAFGIPALYRAESKARLSGEIETLQYLYANKHNPESIAAILFAASLFSRFQSSRRIYPDNWPRSSIVYPLVEAINQKLKSIEAFNGWTHTCTSVLPGEDGFREQQLGSLHEVILELAGQHAEVLLKYRAVSVDFKTESDPDIAPMRAKEKSRPPANG